MDINDITSALGGSQALQDAAGNAGVDTDTAQGILGAVLAHASDGGPVEGLVDGVAQRAGVDPSVVQQFLPQVMPLLQAHADNAPDGAQGGLSSLMGMVGPMVEGAGAGQSGGGAGGLLGMVSGLFGSRD